jgi:hypothetical protein
MAVSQGVGFSLHNFALKAYLILVDPHAWIGGGEGLIRRCPWMILGLAGLATTIRRPVPRMLSLTLLAHAFLYLSYVDLSPTGFWRFFNVHYWTCAIPGFAILGVILCRDLVKSESRIYAAAALCAVIAIVGIRIEPKRTATEPLTADAVDFSKAPGAEDFNYISSGNWQITDATGVLHNNTHQIRALPYGNGGVRIIAVTRSFVPPVRVQGTGFDDLQPSDYLKATIRWKVPFLPWIKPGDDYGPHL